MPRLHVKILKHDFYVICSFSSTFEARPKNNGDGRSRNELACKLKTVAGYFINPVEQRVKGVRHARIVRGRAEMLHAGGSKLVNDFFSKKAAGCALVNKLRRKLVLINDTERATHCDDIA